MNAKLNTKLVVEPVVPSAKLFAKLVVELIVEPSMAKPTRTIPKLTNPECMHLSTKESNKYDWLSSHPQPNPTFYWHYNANKKIDGTSKKSVTPTSKLTTQHVLYRQNPCIDKMLLS